MKSITLRHRLRLFLILVMLACAALCRTVKPDPARGPY